MTMKQLTGIGLLTVVFLTMTGTGWAVDWYANWAYRQKITIDAAKVSGGGVLTNFPLLITETNIQSGFWSHIVRTNGLDLVVTAGDGVTKIPFEVEKCDVVSSQLCVWARLPEVSATNNTTFYLYYGTDNGNQSDAGTLWSNYRAVWHMAEPSGTSYDSSTNHLSAAPAGVVSSVTGRIDGARGLDGANSYLNMSGGTIHDGSTNVGAISMWFRSASTPALYSALFDTDMNSGVLMWMYPGGVQLSCNLRQGTPNITDTTYFTGLNDTWIYVTLVWSNGTAKLYRNGAWRKNGACTANPTATTGKIGYHASSIYLSAARMDEVRVCARSLSDDWIATEFNNQNSPYTFAGSSAEESKPSQRSSAAWYSDLARRNKRQRLIVDATRVSGDGILTNFPVLITETNVDSALWRQIQTNGADILFTAGDGVTKIPYEIEKCDGVASQLCAWVRLPEVSATTDTLFYVYYGNAGATNESDARALWSDYRAVWHWAEPSGVSYDSSSNRLYAYAPLGGASNVTGRIGSAQGFDGTKGYLAMAGGTIFDGSTNVGAISMWVRSPTQPTVYKSPFNTSRTSGIQLYVYPGNGQLSCYLVNSAANITDTTYFPTALNDTWIYVTLVWNNGTAKLYRNGAFRASGAYTGAPSASDGKLGYVDSSSYWNWKMDEVRVCAKPLSDDWIASEFNNQSGLYMFVLNSGEETFPYQGSIVIVR